MSLGRDKFFDLLRKQQLLIRRKRKYAVTTQSLHRFRVYKNKMIGLKLSQPGQAWVCDITYVRTTGKFVYLFLITDAFSRKIIGWHMSNSLAVEGARKAVAKAIKQCPNTRGVIHHSDRGFQYCSPQYVKPLEHLGIQISMAEAGNCYENAIAERINGILKQEYGLDEIFSDQIQAERVTGQGIKAYNEQRPHWSLEFKTPAQVHQNGYNVKNPAPCLLKEQSPGFSLLM